MILTECLLCLANLGSHERDDDPARNAELRLRIRGGTNVLMNVHSGLR
jgi:hypothetical protein